MAEHDHSGQDAPGASGLAAKTLCALVGFGAVLGQIVLMRELMAILNGNELALGILLAVWLFWTATGSALLCRAFRDGIRLRVAAAVALALWGASLPLTICVVRASRSWFTRVPGELLGPLPMLAIPAVSMCVFCLLSGGLFALSSRMLAPSNSPQLHSAPARAYLLETFGAAAGGLFTSFVLLHVFGSLQIGMFLFIVDACIAAAIFMRATLFWKLAIAPIGFVLLLPLLYGVAPRLEVVTLQHSWRGFRVLASQDSMYGRLTVTEAGGMRSLYDNGANLANIPDKPAAEEAVHIALLEHAAPRRILLIGGGMNGSVSEALRHDTLERLDYVDLDPALPILYSHLFPAESQAAFADPRVHAWSGDARAYLASAPALYDVILVNVPEPDTAQWNRFYTAEFFTTARAHLRDDGILALQLHAGAEVISPPMAELLRCIHATLREVFPSVAVIPGDSAHLLAARQNVLTEDPRTLVDRLHARNLRTTYVREYFLPFRMSPDRIVQMHQILQRASRARINRDFHPQAYYFGTVVWSSQFRSGYARLLESLAGVSFPPVVLTLSVLLLVLVMAIFASGNPARALRIAGRWSLLSTGFNLMTLQILLLLAFQALRGYLFYQLAVLIGMLMGGIALGNWLGMRAVGRGRFGPLPGRLALVQVGLAMTPLAVLAMASVLAGTAAASEHPRLLDAAFVLLTTVSGIPGGMQFPMAAALRRSSASRGLPSAGMLYALDLLGGCAGALLLSGFLIPLYGFWNTAWLACAVGLAPALLLALRGAGGRISGQRAPATLQTRPQ